MLCSFAQQFPFFVETFLRHGGTLRRRFREETVTDLMMGSLMTAGGGRLVVEFPNEPVTGADMEWNFVDPDAGTFFRIMLQAKQAYGEGSVWTRHCYRGLLHTSGAGAKPQAEALCDSARHPGSATYPLYIFYHSGWTCDLARSSGVHDVAGVNIADGFVIERLVKSATTRRLRTRNKNLRTIKPSLFPLSTLFCPISLFPVSPLARADGLPPFPMYAGRLGGRPTMGFAIPPSPDEIRARLDKMRERFQIAAVAPFDAEADFKLPDIPRVSNSIPDDVQEILGWDEERGRAEPELDRWRLTFLSASAISHGDA